MPILGDYPENPLYFSHEDYRILVLDKIIRAYLTVSQVSARACYCTSPDQGISEQQI